MTSDEKNVSSETIEPMCTNVPSADMKSGTGLVARRGLATFAAVALIALAGFAGMHAASAEVSQPVAEQARPQPTKPGSVDEGDLLRRGELLIAFRTWTQALPGIDTSGYVDSVNDPEAGSTVLIWYGLPDNAQRQILDEAARRNIAISIQQCKYSPATLERAVQQLIAIKSGTGAFQNFMVSGVGSFGEAAYDSITVKGDYIHPPAEGIAAADSALAQELSTKTGVAVTIEHGQIAFGQPA